MGQVPSTDDLLSMIKDLQRRLSAVETRSPLNTTNRGTFTNQGNIANTGNITNTGTFTDGNVSINNGELIVKDNAGNTIIELGLTSDGRYGLRVNDTSGNPQIRLGQLAAGGYGLEVVSGGQLVPLSNLIFGIRAARVITTESTTSASFTDLATVGPQVTVNITNSGTALVFLSALMPIVSGSGPTMGVALSGANTQAAGTFGQYLNGNVVGGSGNANATRVAFISNLNPGATTFTAKYEATTGTATFADREIAVLPY